ncbi:MAG: putative metallo-hydrolase YycJ [Firmicutes bacterium]|nr:putative metallo-hydrolase YycJ [candidate division NPL-UPA2 bacterium]
MLRFQSYASGSSGNLYTVSDGQTKLLIECGIPLAKIRRALKFRVHEIAGCFVSHGHQDHFKAAGDLVRAGMDIYALNDTIAAGGLIGHRVHAVKALVEVQVGTFKVLPFDVQHDVPTLGFLFTSTVTGEKLLYFTDTYYVKYLATGLTIIAAECNYDKGTLQRNVAAGHVSSEVATRLMKSHMSLECLLDMLRANDLSQVRQIYLLHLSETNSDERRYKEAVQELTGAEVYVC